MMKRLRSYVAFGLLVMVASWWLGCAKAAQRVAYRAHAPRAHLQSQKAHRSHGIARRSEPGLGTAYGRSVYAPIRYVSFVRSSSRPAAMMRIYYNNPRGVMAMARYAHGHHCCGPVAVRHANGVSLQLIDPRHGSVLSGVAIRGKTFVMGRHGRDYHILLRNHTGRRKEAVVSVDGLDVIDGRRGRTSKRGYIIRPYGVLRIKGFRRSRSQVAAFRFSTVRGSYAARMGRGRNVGVIGVALFDEHRIGWRRDQLHRRFSASPFE